MAETTVTTRNKREGDLAIALATSETDIVALKLGGTFRTKAGAPIAADIPAGQWAVFRNSTGGEIALWANYGGTLVRAVLSAPE